MNLSRRLFLRNSAAAGATLATVSAPVVAEAIQQEHPQILRAGEKLPAMVAEFQEAARLKQEARAEYERTKPDVSRDLTVIGPCSHYCAERETDVEGNLVWPADRTKPPRAIMSADLIAERHRHQFGRGKVGKEMKRLHALAETYEKGCEAAKHASGIEDAMDRHSLAVDALRNLAWNVAEIPPHSLTGLVIKARIMTAYGACGPREETWVLGTAKRMPADVLAVFGRGGEL